MKKIIIFIILILPNYSMSLPITIFNHNVRLDTNLLFKRALKSPKIKHNNILLDYSNNDIIVGYFDPNETVTINNDYILNANIIIVNNGMLEINSQNFTLNGNITILNNGNLKIKNSKINIIQSYPYEKSLNLINNSKVSISNTEIQTSNYSWSISLSDSSSYIIEDSKIINGFITCGLMKNANAKIINVKTPGEFLCFNSSNIDFLNSDFILMWLVTPDKSDINISLPQDSVVNNWSFSEKSAKVSGINYSISIDNCTNVQWGCISETGSHSIFRNSEFRAFGLRITSSDSVYIKGLTNNSRFEDKKLNISDRYIKLINSKVKTWNFYSSNNSTLTIDNSIFGEILSQDNSKAYVNNSICDGTGGYVGSFNHSKMQWVESLIKSSFISRENSILIAINSAITSFEINSDETSVMLIANTIIKTLPFAQDTSAIFNILMYNTKGYINDQVPIIGSAWVKSGKFNPVKLTKYKIEYSKADESNNWKFINEFENKKVSNNVLVNWNTKSLSPGIYKLKLTLYYSFNDSINIESIARLDTNFNLGTIKIPNTNNDNLIKIIPNPMSDKTTISYSLKNNSKVIIDIYDNQGKKVENLISKYLSSGRYSLTWNMENIRSGIYYCVLNIDGILTKSKKIIVIK